MSNNEDRLDSGGLLYVFQRLKTIFTGLFPSRESVIDISEKGTANGVAELDGSGKVPASQLPSFVDDVVEYASLADFPETGESGKIYVALDTNKTYRWGGSEYVAITSDLALGETSSTAYRGDRGKAAYDHSQAKGTAHVNGLYKVTTNSEGHVTEAFAVSKADITALGVPGQDTTYENATHETAGLMSAEDKTKLDGAGLGITGITMNGEPQTVVDSVADLGTVLREHQDISGKLDASEKGAANGVAELDNDGKVPSSQLPSYVDDVVEYPSLSQFPAAGESGKIYVALDTNKTYRWSGTTYVAISSDLALGETSSTAYRGDRGKTAYDHATDNGRLTTAQTSGLYKIATTKEGHVASVTPVAKSDITALGIPGQDTTYSDMTGAGASSAGDHGLVPAPAAGDNMKFLRGDGTWAETGGGSGSYATDIPMSSSDSTSVYNAIGEKTDKVPGATNGNFASFDSNGNVQDSGSKASDFLTQHQDISGKADKVPSATNGNFASLDSNGNLTDSGHKHSDYLTQHQDISRKADKVSNATSGNFASLDGNGNLTDSGNKASDFLTSHQDISGKADKVSNAEPGNFAGLDSNGNLIDSGHKHSDYITDISGKIDTTEKGAANGVAELGSDGKVPSSQLPSYVDDVLEFASVSAFPLTGESGKIYIALDTNKTYRWSGSTYAIVGNDLALGETSSTAYRGDRGKTAYDHATDNGRLTTAQTSGLYKIATTKEGHVASVTPAAKSDITALGIPGQDTTYSDMTGATSSTAGTHGLVPAPAAGDESLVLTAGGTWEESPGAKLVVATLTVTNTSGAYSNTVSDERITASMKPICIEIGTPATFNSTISVTSGDGQYTISCSAVSGTSSVTISFQKVVEDPSAVTSSEFDLLNNRIGTLSNLTTTAKTNVVAAINEVVANKINTSDIANNLTTTTEGKVLDARQGKSLSDAIANIDGVISRRVKLKTAAWGGTTVSYTIPQDGKMYRFTAMNPSGTLCHALILMRSDVIKIANVASNNVTFSYSDGVLTLTLPSNSYWECYMECMFSTHAAGI